MSLKWADCLSNCFISRNPLNPSCLNQSVHFFFPFLLIHSIFWPIFYLLFSSIHTSFYRFEKSLFNCFAFLWLFRFITIVIAVWKFWYQVLNASTRKRRKFKWIEQQNNTNPSSCLPSESRFEWACRQIATFQDEVESYHLIEHEKKQSSVRDVFEEIVSLVRNIPICTKWHSILRHKRTTMLFELNTCFCSCDVCDAIRCLLLF